MINTINSDLIRGHIDTIILSVLHEGDRYGYDILGEIEKKSGGQYVLKQPTLYSCLKRLETQGFIYKYWGTETNGGRRTYYSLTDMGKELFLKNKNDWKYSRGVIDKLISTSDDIINENAIYVEVATTKEAENISVTENIEEKTDDTQNVADELISKETETNDNNPVEQADQDKVSAEYAEVLAEAEKQEILSPASDTVSDITDSISNYNESEKIEAYSYADRLNHEVVETKRDDIFSFGSSFFASDYNEEDDEDADDSGYEIVTEENEETFELDVNTYVNEHPASFTDKPFYNDSDFDDKENDQEHAEPEESLFKSYENATLSEETDREIVIGREYRNIIKLLLTSDADSDINDVEADIEAESNENIVDSTPEINDEVILPSEIEPDVDAQKTTPSGEFDDLLLSVRSMGDEIRIRSHNGAVEKKYNELYNYYSNKLNLFKYGILFGIMILEIVIPYFIIKFGFNISIFGELPILVISVVGAAILPIFAISAYLIDPFKRKRYEFELKTSILYRTGIMALILILIYAVNVVLYMDISFEAEYAFSLISPALLSTNIPISALIYKKLFDTKQFTVE